MASKERFTLSVAEARELLRTASPSGRELLELFAEHQVVSFRDLKKVFKTTQSGLNGILSHLVGKFREITAAPDSGFYIYIEDRHEWAVGYFSRNNLRKALRTLRHV